MQIKQINGLLVRCGVFIFHIIEFFICFRSPKEFLQPNFAQITDVLILELAIQKLTDRKELFY